MRYFLASRPSFAVVELLNSSKTRDFGIKKRKKAEKIEATAVVPQDCLSDSPSSIISTYKGRQEMPRDSISNNIYMPIKSYLIDPSLLGNEINIAINKIV